MADKKITEFDAITPTDNDVVAIVDVETDVTKKTLWSTIKSTLKTYFDGLYPSGSGTSSGTNTGDQEASDFNHDSLSNISGTPGEYNHPTDAQMTVLGNTSGTNSGDNAVNTNYDGLAKDSKSITIESPGAAEDISMFFTNEAITITEIRAILVGADTPSVTWTIRHGTDRSATGAEAVTGGTTTTSVSSGSDVTSFNDATIVADSFVWLETTAKSGTVTTLSITIIYELT